MARTAVVLLSGGLDSATCLGLVISQGYEPVALTFLYGQRHAVETERARKLAAHYEIPPDRRRLLDLGRILGASSLTGAGEIPTKRSEEEMAAGIPSTYVPARNLLFLSLAAAWAEETGAGDIFIGVNTIDYSGYPDCRPEFIGAFETAVNLGTRGGAEGRPIRIHTPLARLSKKEIISLGHALGVPLHLTHSCYQGTVPACGECDSCLLRLKGFREAGLIDPIPYTAPVEGEAAGEAPRDPVGDSN